MSEKVFSIESLQSQTNPEVRLDFKFDKNVKVLQNG